MNLILLFEPDFLNQSKVTICDPYRLNHLDKVLKAATGSVVKVGKLNGPMGKGTITSFEKDRCEIEVELTISPPAPAPVTLVLAMPRPKSFKKSIEAATVMGVKQIVIIQSWRVEKSYWSTPALEEHVLTPLLYRSLEQAVDTVMPSIRVRRRFKPFVEDELPQIIGSGNAFVAHPYDSAPLPPTDGSHSVVVIGPEGGFIPFEVDLLKKSGCTTASLGERIMRVEHAVGAFLGKLL